MCERDNLLAGYIRIFVQRKYEAVNPTCFWLEKLQQKECCADLLR